MKCVCKRIFLKPIFFFKFMNFLRQSLQKGKGGVNFSHFLSVFQNSFTDFDETYRKQVLKVFFKIFVWTNPSTNAAALASNWLTHFRLLCNHCMDSMKLNRKQVLKVFYQVCIFCADMSTNMAALAFDWLTHFQRISTKLYRKQVLKIIYLVCVFRADPLTNMAAWPLIGWDFSATAAWISSELYGKQVLNIL